MLILLAQETWYHVKICTYKVILDYCFCLQNIYITNYQDPLMCFLACCTGYCFYESLMILSYNLYIYFFTFVINAMQGSC